MLRAGRLPGSPAGEGRCKTVAPSSDRSVAELERCLAVAAYLVVRYGEAYTPTFERLECEVEQLRLQLGKRERAQRVLATLIQNGIGHVGAA